MTALAYTFQSAAVATGNGTAASVLGRGGLAVQVTGITTATVTWEGTIDGTNYVGLYATNIATGVLGLTATANGVYLLG